MMQIELWEPPKRRLRIKNKIRFTVSVIILLLILLLIIPKDIKDVFTERFEITKQQLAYWLK